MSLEKVLETAIGADGVYLYGVMLRAYAKFDVSHGYDHIAKVVEWLEKILALESIRDGSRFQLSTDERLLAYVAAVVHDWCDPKYTGVCDFDVRAAISARFGVDFDDRVHEIITHMSYSAETASMKEGRVVGYMLYPADDRVRRCVQAADWLTSVGKEGLVKSLQYNYHILGHRDEKLYAAVRDLHATRLVSYIKTVTTIADFPGIELFAQAHEEMQACVDDLKQLAF